MPLGPSGARLKRTHGSFYSFPRNVFTSWRIAFSLRRYQRHCPFLVASTSPALVRIAMWCEIVGCDRETRSSISPAHRHPPVAFASATPSLRACRMRRRVGSVMACSARSRDASVKDMDGLAIARLSTGVNVRNHTPRNPAPTSLREPVSAAWCPTLAYRRVFAPTVGRIRWYPDRQRAPLSEWKRGSAWTP